MRRVTSPKAELRGSVLRGIWVWIGKQWSVRNSQPGDSPAVLTAHLHLLSVRPEPQFPYLENRCMVPLPSQGWELNVLNTCPAGVSNLHLGMRPRMAMNAAQHKIINLLITFLFACLFSLVFLYLMCGPRQLFFHCGPEMPKGWTPLVKEHSTVLGTW